MDLQPPIVEMPSEVGERYAELLAAIEAGGEDEARKSVVKQLPRLIEALEALDRHESPEIRLQGWLLRAQLHLAAERSAHGHGFGQKALDAMAVLEGERHNLPSSHPLQAAIDTTLLD